MEPSLYQRIYNYFYNYYYNTLNIEEDKDYIINFPDTTKVEKIIHSLHHANKILEKYESETSTTYE